MNTEYFIGQTFIGMYPEEAKYWCDAHNAKITEIEPIETEKGMERQFRIYPQSGETDIQKQERMLAVRDSYFEKYVDWYQSKPLLWSEMTKAEKDEIKAYRIYLKDYNNTENWWENEPMDFETWKESK